MSCCNCRCSPCSCNVTEVRVPAPEARVYHFNDGNCCPIKGWYETLEIASWTPPAAGDTTLIAVCDATQYPVGTCVKVSDGTNSAVLKVTGWNKDKDAIYVLGYNNAENVGGTMSGLINSFPLAVCPVETESEGVVCDRDYMVTAEAFVMPLAISNSGGTVKLVFDTPQTLQLGMTIYVVGAGYMQIEVPPGGTFITCGTEFYAYNLGSSGNAAPGTTIQSGAAAYPDSVPPSVAAGTIDEDNVESFTAGLVDLGASINVTYPGSLTFTTTWPSDIRLMWKVGHPMGQTGLWHAHWRIKLAQVKVEDYTSLANAKSDASNDADMSGHMASSNWGHVVVKDVPAGTWIAWIEKYAQTIPGTLTLDTWRIDATAMRIPAP